MSDLSLFLLGGVIMIPAAICTVGLVLAAIRDGREEERYRADESDGRAAPARPVL